MGRESEMVDRSSSVPCGVSGFPLRKTTVVVAYTAASSSRVDGGPGGFGADFGKLELGELAAEELPLGEFGVGGLCYDFLIGGSVPPPRVGYGSRLSKKREELPLGEFCVDRKGVG